MLQAHELNPDNPNINYSLGLFYELETIYKDICKAENHLIIAMENGHEEAAFQIGALYDKNAAIHYKDNVLKAKEYYEFAINTYPSKNSKAMNNLGYIYLCSLSEPNYFSGESWLWLAYKYGNKKALNNYNINIKNISENKRKIIESFNTVEDYKQYKKNNNIYQDDIKMVSTVPMETISTNTTSVKSDVFFIDYYSKVRILELTVASAFLVFIKGGIPIIIILWLYFIFITYPHNRKIAKKMEELQMKNFNNENIYKDKE